MTFMSGINVCIIHLSYEHILYPDCAELETFQCLFEARCCSVGRLRTRT